MDKTLKAKFVERAIGLFPELSSRRHLWLRGLKTLLRVGMRLNLIPERDRLALGYLYDQIVAGGLKERSHSFQRELVIELSSICNAKCSFCPYPRLEFPRKLMPEATFHRALDLAAGLGIREFDLTPYLGEAFVDPQLLHRIGVLRHRFPEARIQFTTNGTFFLRFDCEAILRSGVSRINVSFGAWGREDYKKLYCIDAWDTVLAGVQKLLDTKRSLKANVFIALWYRVLDVKRVQNHAENKLFLDAYQGVVDDVSYTGVFHDIPSISGRQPEHIQLAPQVDSSTLKRSPCAHLSKLGVSSTGKMFMCYCAATDCYKGNDSWFYLGEIEGTPDLNGRLAAKAEAWQRGTIPLPCRSCPIYIPSDTLETIEYSRG